MHTYFQYLNFPLYIIKNLIRSFPIVEILQAPSYLIAMSVVSKAPLMLRLLSAGVAAANRAGQIIREVLKGGQLSIVDKVYSHHHRRL